MFFFFYVSLHKFFREEKTTLVFFPCPPVSIRIYGTLNSFLKNSMKNTCFCSAIARAEKTLRVHFYYVSTDDRADALYDSILRFLEIKYSFEMNNSEHDLPAYLMDENECTLWLTRVAQRRLVSHWRKMRHAESISSIIVANQQQITETIESLHSFFPQSDISYDCRTALQRLNRLTRECFELHHNGLTYYEIAAQLNISDSCAQKRYQRAKQELQRLLNSYAV